MAAVAHHFFYALRPPGPQRACLARHRDRFDRGVRSRVSSERLHMTLASTHRFDRFPEALARRMIDWAAALSAEPVRLRLDRLSGCALPARDHKSSIAVRPARRPPGLSDISRRLSEPLERAGMLREGWSFNPHVTLLYWQGHAFEQPIEPIRWEATDFVLIYSVVGMTRHIELGRWPLDRRQRAFGF